MSRTRTFTDPPFAATLWGSTSFSWLWLAVRMYVGWQWLYAGWEKFTSPAWMNDGTALKAFWERAVVVPETGRASVAFDWYREFLLMLLQGGHHVWFAKLVVFGEQAVGIALILGAFTGIAAGFGAFMNWNFMMAGTASTNPVLFVLALLLVMAWKTAGYYGLDRWLLPALGTAWQPGELFQPRRREDERQAAHAAHL